MGVSLVSLENIYLSFDKKVVLQNLSLDLRAGEVQSIIGLSGAGKTSLLKLIAGLEKPSSGKLKNNLKTSFVFQTQAFFPWLNIFKNLEICSGKNQTEIMQALTEFHLLPFAFCYPAELSGGTLQKVNILRAFLSGAELILMDEPFVHLDVIQKEEQHALVEALWKKHKNTVLLVTHDIDEALKLSATLFCLSKKEKTITKCLSVAKQPDCHTEVYSFLKGDFHV